MGEPVSDLQALAVHVLWECGASRQQVADFVERPWEEIFDRTREARGRGRLAHPSFADLPKHQGRGGGPSPGSLEVLG